MKHTSFGHQHFEFAHEGTEGILSGPRCVQSNLGHTIDMSSLRWTYSRSRDRIACKLQNLDRHPVATPQGAALPFMLGAALPKLMAFCLARGICIVTLATQLT